LSGLEAAEKLVAFMTMGGHGVYVWLSYGAGLAVVLFNLLSVRIRERRYLREQVDQARRHGAAADPTGPNAGVSQP
jgi:heme exporter protein D